MACYACYHELCSLAQSIMPSVLPKREQLFGFRISEWTQHRACATILRQRSQKKGVAVHRYDDAQQLVLVRTNHVFAMLPSQVAPLAALCMQQRPILCTLAAACWSGPHATECCRHVQAGRLPPCCAVRMDCVGETHSAKHNTLLLQSATSVSCAHACSSLNWHAMAAALSSVQLVLQASVYYYY